MPNYAGNLKKAYDKKVSKRDFGVYILFGFTRQNNLNKFSLHFDIVSFYLFTL